MNTEYLIWGAAGLSVILLLAVVWQAWRLARLERFRKEFFSSGLAQDLDDILVRHNSTLKELTDNFDQMSEFVSGLAMANRKNYQKIGFVRFNPFDDAGGSISFVLALLDADSNGIVISSLHGREGDRVYAKEVKKGQSESQLTQEEQRAIKQAR